MPNNPITLDTSAPACISLAEARARPSMQNHPWSLLLNHGSLEVHRHGARSVGESVTHARDMVYVVLNGRGTLTRDGYDFPFGPGDLLFVPANLTQRFSGITAEFEAYAILYGPEGGEAVGQYLGTPATRPIL